VANRSDEGRLVRGRDAARRQSWEETFDAFADAEANGEPFLPTDLETWSVSAYLLGRLDEALDAMTAAHNAHARAGDIEDAVRCGFWMSHMLVGQGDIAQAGGWIARCRRLIGDTPPTHDRTSDYCDLFESFRLIALERRYQDGIDVASRIVESNRTSGDRDLYALGLNNIGRARIRMGSVTPGIQALDEAMVAVVSSEVSPAAAGTVYCSLIEACEEIADLGRAQEWTGALTDWCGRQNGMVTFTGQCLSHRSAILRRRGDWAGAEAEARRACERFMRAAAHMVGRALYELGEVHRLRGDTAGAEDAYRRAREAGHEPQPGLALLRLSQGRIDAAAAALDRLLTERTDTVSRVPLLGPHVDVMLEALRIEDAHRSASELEAAAQTFGTSALEAESDRAVGAVMLARGDADSAIGRLRRARASWDRLSAPYEAARTQLLLSRACRALGDGETADSELEMARSTFERLGARPELSRIPTDGRRSTHGLSSRELEVLRLVASGMTNQEIADELYLAVKTVDRHVSNILTKLDVGSRTAAAAFAYRNALV